MTPNCAHCGGQLLDGVCFADRCPSVWEPYRPGGPRSDEEIRENSRLKRQMARWDREEALVAVIQVLSGVTFIGFLIVLIYGLAKGHI